MSCALFLGPSSFCIIIESALVRFISIVEEEWERLVEGRWAEGEEGEVEGEGDEGEKEVCQ